MKDLSTPEIAPREERRHVKYPASKLSRELASRIRAKEREKLL